MRCLQLAGLPLVLLLVLALATGCTSVIPLSDTPDTLGQVNETLAGQPALMYVDGRRDPARVDHVTITVDSVYYNDRRVRLRDVRFARSLPVSRLDSVSVDPEPYGGTIGMSVGAAPGVAMYADAATSYGDCASVGCGLARAYQKIGAVTVGVAGMLLGALIGNAVEPDAEVVYRRPLDRYLDVPRNSWHVPPPEVGGR